MTLADMTTKQLDRLHANIWRRMTAGDGYQPFGYDARTLKLTKPTWYALCLQLHAEYKRRESKFK